MKSVLMRYEFGQSLDFYIDRRVVYAFLAVTTSSDRVSIVQSEPSPCFTKYIVNAVKRVGDLLKRIADIRMVEWAHVYYDAGNDAFSQNFDR